jgi:hypothetical protein
MGNLLFIDSDDINGLSDALRNALERRGIKFRDNTGEFGYPTNDDEEPDIDPFFGVIPKTPHYTPSQYGGCGGWTDEVGYGGCGSKVNACGSWEAPNIHHSGGSCGDSYYYPRC